MNRFISWSRSFSTQPHRWGSLIVISIACCVLLGWIFTNIFFTSILPTLRPTNPMLAVGLGLAAWSLFLTERPSSSALIFSGRRVSAIGFACVVVVIGALRLIGYYAGCNLCVDQLLFPEQLATISGNLSGRMGLSAAFNLILCGLALVLVNFNLVRAYRLIHLWLIIVILMSILALVGYIYQIRTFVGINLYVMMALQAASMFIILAIGVLALFPQKGLIGLLLSNNLGGRLSRSLLPTALLVPLVVGYLCLELKQYVHLDRQLGVGLVVVCIMFSFSFIIYIAARVLNRIDSQRKKALKDLLEQQKFLSAISTTTPDSILVYDLPKERVIYCNKETEILFGYPIKEMKMSADSDWFTHLVHPDDKQRLAAFFALLPQMADEELNETEFRIKYPSGQEKWLCNRVAVFARDDQGKVAQLITWEHDITSQKNNELRINQLLKEAQELNDTLLIREEEARQALSEALVLNEKLKESETNFAEAQIITQLGSWYFDRDHAILKWSDQLYRNYDLVPQQQAPSLDLFLTIVHPEDQTNVKHLIEHLEQYSQPYSSEIRLIWNSGEERTARMIINYQLDENQTVKTVFGTVQDITELKKVQQQVQDLLKETQTANEELAASEEALRETLDQTLELNCKLEESQLELDEAHKIAHLGRWSSDIAKRRLSYSDEMYRLFDISHDPAHLNADNFLTDRIHPDDREKGGKAIADAITEAKPFEMEIRLLTGNQETRWGYIICKPMVDETGKVVRLIGTTMDITERKLAEIALRESEDRYRKLVELLPDAILITNEGAITYTNPAAIKMFGGYTAEDLIGRMLKDHLRNNFKQLIHDLGDTDLTEEPVSFSTDILTRLDGSNIDAEVDTAPLLINSEKGSLILIRDVTERRKAEKALLDSEQFYKAIFRNSSDFIQTVNAQGEVIYQSPAFYRLTGYYPDERKGHNVLEIVHPDDHEEALKFLALLLEKPGISLSLEVRILHKNGIWRWIESTATNLLQKSAVRAVVMNNRDITERKLAEEQLKQQNEELKKINAELDRFVYRASHDLRAPLASLLGLISITRQELDSTQVIHYLMLMEKSVSKLDTFIQNIITYSRNARLTIDSTLIDFEALITDTFEDMKYLNRSEGIEKRVHLELKSDFFSDNFRIKIIFNNIISNAIRYSNPGTSSFIAIRIVATQEQATIEFEDNGLGIPPESIDKIFDMFYRASESNVGSGLGLYIVKEVAEALKGTIEVESQLGLGTLFRFVLPNFKNTE